MPTDRAKHVELLLEAGRLLATKLDLADLLKTILELASKVVGSERASVLLLDEKTRCLYFDVALGLGPEVSNLRFPLGEGIAGAVAAERQGAIINDVRADGRWSASADEKTGFVTRSILAVPMRHQDKLLGVLEAINKTDGGFDGADLGALEAFASQAAVALENARLFSSLREERAMLDTMFARMTDGALLTDAQGAVLLSNQAARRILSLGEPHKDLPAALAGMESKPPVAEVLSRSAGEPVELELARDKPTKLVLSGLATGIELSTPGSQAQARPGIFWFLRDVTEERRKESLKRTFLSLMSHKLKTPLTAITGYAELLASDPPQGSSPPDLKALQAINQQGQRLSSLVSKLLKFTTIESDDFPFKSEPVSLDTVLQDTVWSMKEWLQEHKASVRLPESAPSVLGDQDLLGEVFKNLIENAVKFDSKPEREVVIEAAGEGGLVRVSIKDTGQGIPPEEQEKVFVPFHQVEESFTGQVEGAGLGLAYVKKVVERHEGEVSLRSALGEGTSVTVTLAKAPD